MVVECSGSNGLENAAGSIPATNFFPFFWRFPGFEFERVGMDGEVFEVG